MRKLTKDERAAILAVARGGDVTSYTLARTLLAVEKDFPGYVDIGPVMNRYSVYDKLPYFGAIATSAGRRAVKAR